MHRPLVPLLLTPLAVLALLTGCGSSSSGSTGGSQAAATPFGWHGVEPSPVPSRPSFVLTDTEGRRYDFRAETAGRPTLVYFGYTNCPDLCPTAMADIAAALRKADPDVRKRTVVVFVSTDPARDSAPVIRRFLDQFSAGFVGLRGSQAEVDAAQEAAGVDPARQEGPVPTVPGRPDQHVHQEGTAPHQHFGPLGYAVAHSAVIFAYDADDRLPVVYPDGVTPADIAADLPALADPPA